jgi:antitoxin YokJ
MKSIEELIRELEVRPDCHFYSPLGLPFVPPDLVLPHDLAVFYERYGEARLFGEKCDPRCHILPPEEFVQVGIDIWGEATTEGIERSWYGLAHVQDGNYFAIDLLPTRLGWCYDCFHETYREPGYCKGIARSLTELLTQVADAGDRAFWLDAEFRGCGDAYDDRR